MKILFLNPYLPLPLTSGDNVRSFWLMKQVSRSHRVTALVYANRLDSPALSSLREFCESYYQIQQKSAFFGFFSRGNRTRILKPFRHLLQKQMQQTLQNLLANDDWELLHCGHPALLPLVPAACPIPVVLQFDSSHAATILCRVGVAPDGALRKRQTRERELHRFLASAFRRAAVIIVPTEQEREAVLRLQPDARVHIVRHGVDVAYFKNHRFEKSSKTIVITGAMDRQVNADGVRFFIEHVWPEVYRFDREIRLFVVGRKPPEDVFRYNRMRNIHVTGEVLDLRPFLAGASVAVFPQLEGGSAGVKILEALAMAVPVACSAQSCCGLNLENGEHALISESPHKMAQNILTLLHNKQMSDRIARAARVFSEAHHSWDVVAEQLLEAYREVTAGGEAKEGTTPITRVEVPDAAPAPPRMTKSTQ